MSKPSPTVVDNVLRMLRSGQAFIRGAFRGNSGLATPPRQTPPPPQGQHHHHHHNRPVRPSRHHPHRIVLVCLTGIDLAVG
jgi:hypothetical protein